ncbi:MAG: hypothetical protein ACRDQA_23460, partial [Nocardioidaceae bacterium]
FLRAEQVRYGDVPVAVPLLNVFLGDRGHIPTLPPRERGGYSACRWVPSWNVVATMSRHARGQTAPST